MTETSELVPVNVPFINVERITPCSNQYRLRFFVRLKGFTFDSYSPEKFTYERVGGVNFRFTVLYVLPGDPEKEETVYKEFELLVNRKEEDSIYIELQSIHEYQHIQDTEEDSDEKLYTRSFQMLSTTETAGKKIGGGGGTFEP
jgi:hypothetical protein